MKPCYKLLFIIFLLPLFSVAQSNYQPGFVVIPKGDTLKGFIDYREWNTNPNSINFKTTVTDNKVTKYMPGDITAFAISGLEWYQLYTGKITMDSVDPDRVQEGRDSSTKTVSVFLKIIQKGKRLTLYSYIDDVKTRFFIKENGQQVTELIFRRYFSTAQADAASHTGRTVNESTYLNQLYSISQKYNTVNDSFQWQIEHTEYNKADIYKICSKINELSNDDSKKQGDVKNGIHLFAGLALSSSTTKAAGTYQAAGGKSYTSNLPSISVGADFLANPNTGKLVFRAELSIGQNQYKSVYTNQFQPEIPVKYAFNQTEFSFIPQVIYNFYNAKNLKIYGGLGAAISKFSYSSAQFQSADGTVPGADITTYNPYDFANFGTLAMFRAGVQFSRKLEIYAIYLGKFNNSNDPYFQTNLNTIRVGVNYIFK